MKEASFVHGILRNEIATKNRILHNRHLDVASVSKRAKV
jgi:hypothetical protein